MVKKRHLMEMKFETEASEPAVSVSNCDFKKQQKRARSRWVEKRKLVTIMGWSLFQEKAAGVSRHFWFFFYIKTAGVFFNAVSVLSVVRLFPVFTHADALCGWTKFRSLCVVQDASPEIISSRSIMRHVPVRLEIKSFLHFKGQL